MHAFKDNFHEEDTRAQYTYAALQLLDNEKKKET